MDREPSATAEAKSREWRIDEFAHQSGVPSATIRFYQQHGFRLVPTAERDRLLSTYWTIPDRQRDTSVVLTRD